LHGIVRDIEGMKGTNAAVGNAMHAFGDFERNVAGGKPGLGTIAEVRFVESAFDLALAGGQLTA
jgi:hypothetical protein